MIEDLELEEEELEKDSLAEWIARIVIKASFIGYHRGLRAGYRSSQEKVKKEE